MSELAFYLCDETTDDTNLKEFDNLIREYFKNGDETRMDLVIAMRYMVKKIGSRTRELNLQRTMHKQRIQKLQALIEAKRK